jgi:hypothetical protein
MIEAAHNPEVPGSNPAPATEKAPETGPSLESPTTRPHFASVARGDGVLENGPRRSVCAMSVIMNRA